MTTNAITCAHFSDRLMAYLEQETDDATRATLERHALSCSTCGPLLADLRELRVEAANLVELTPSRDLWAGIAARIEAPVVPIGTVRRSAPERSILARRGLGGALIAASLVAAASLGYFAARTNEGPSGTRREVASTRPSTDSPKAALPDSALSPAVVEVAPRTPTDAGQFASGATTATVTPVRLPAVDRAYATLVADYDREIARLRTLLEQRRSQLDPVTVAIIEKNLQVIDTAITECKKAIARDPASRFLIESLNQSLQSKLELMRTAALLPSRT